MDILLFKETKGKVNIDLYLLISIKQYQKALSVCFSDSVIQKSSTLFLTDKMNFRIQMVRWIEISKITCQVLFYQNLSLQYAFPTGKCKMIADN